MYMDKYNETTVYILYMDKYKETTVLYHENGISRKLQYYIMYMDKY